MNDVILVYPRAALSINNNPINSLQTASFGPSGGVQLYNCKLVFLERHPLHTRCIGGLGVGTRVAMESEITVVNKNCPIYRRDIRYKKVGRKERFITPDSGSTVDRGPPSLHKLYSPKNVSPN